MSSVSGLGNSYNPFAALQQTLFNEIDTSGSGSITEAELETAVTNAGGTTQAADALYSQLDPNNTGSVTEQQFSQNLPLPSFSPPMASMMIGYQASGWPGSTAGSSGGQFAQNLFNEIDTSGTGSITKSELETAVTNAGGTTQAADALYSQLDPNNTGSVSEQQFAQTLGQLWPHHHHGGGEPANGDSAQDALSALISADGNSANSQTNSASGLAQTLFSAIAPSGASSFTQSELETAVTAAGGTTQAADALYAQLDPNNTGSVSEQQLAQYLQPASPSGNTAQDALAALVQGLNNSNSANTSSPDWWTSSPAIPSLSGNTAQDAVSALVQGLNQSSSASSAAVATSGSITGNTAQDALLAMLQNLDPNSSGTAASNDPLLALLDANNSNQDPLLSLLQSSSGSSTFGLAGSGNSSLDGLLSLLQNSDTGSSNGTNNSSTGSSNNQSNLNLAIALYQGQLAQQSLLGMFGTSNGSGLS